MVVSAVLIGAVFGLIGRIGRRPLLLIGLSGIILALALLGLSYALPSLAGLRTLRTLAGLILYIMSFAASLGVVLWVVLPEIFPLKVRGSAMDVCTILNRSSSLLVSLTFLPLIGAIDEAATFWGFGVIAVGAFAFVFFLMPETKGRSLEATEADLRGVEASQTEAGAASS